jgi:hypothetical protein
LWVRVGALFVIVACIVFVVFVLVLPSVREQVATNVPETQMKSSATDLPKNSPAPIPTQPAASEDNSKPPKAESSPNPAVVSPKKESPTETPQDSTKKPDVPKLTDEQVRDADDELIAQNHEVAGDTDAYSSIGYMAHGLENSNQAEIQHARILWTRAVSEWTFALNKTHETGARYNRLREKIRPENGVSCDNLSCEPNYTHENRSPGLHVPANQFDAQ